MKTVSEPGDWWQECHLPCGLNMGAAQLVMFGLGNSRMTLGSAEQRWRDGDEALQQANAVLTASLCKDGAESSAP